MFDPLVQTSRGDHIQYQPLNLPGFGAPPLTEAKTSLEALATVLLEAVTKLGTDTVLAHSVSSIIASLAARRPNSPVRSILSLEGNLTPDDAYFSGTAANYSNAVDFRTAFLGRLDEIAKADPIIARYRGIVERADARALWELGCDAHRFSQTHSPGQWLAAAPHAAYFFNPKNVPEASLAWLGDHPMPRFELSNASHWASLDQPDQLAQYIKQALDERGF